MRALGADHVIDKSSGDLWRQAERHSPRGYDVVLDANGVETRGGSFSHLAPTGRLVVYGFATMMSRGKDRPSWPKLAVDWLRTPRFDPLTMTNENKSVMTFNLSYLFAALSRSSTDASAERGPRPLGVACLFLESVVRVRTTLEEAMLEIFRNGGVGMYPTALFGLLLLAVAARYAVRPESRWIPLQISLAIVTLTVGATSFVSGLIATTTHLEEIGDRAGIIGAVGFGESLNNVALALALVAIAAMATTVGVARGTRQQAEA